MLIDPIDLRLIRQLELHGVISLTEISAKFHITRDEILLRIKNFEETGFIAGYGIKLFLPTILGGKWYWGCIAAETSKEIGPEKRIPFFEERIENLTFPIGTAPNISLLFYTQDLEESYKLINRFPGINYAEIFKISEYNITLPKILTKDDRHLISSLCNTRLRYEYLNKIVNEPASANDIKLSRLIWHKRNPKGILSIFPNFDWRVIRNFGHLHLAVVTKMRTKELRGLLNKLGFASNIAAKFKKRYLQIEFDLWGFSDMLTVISTLTKTDKLSVAGCSLAYKNRIYDEWIQKFVSDFK